MTQTILGMDEVTGETIANVSFILFLIILTGVIAAARIIRIREQEKTRRILSGEAEPYREPSLDTTEYAENPKVYQRPDPNRTSVFHE